MASSSSRSETHWLQRLSNVTSPFRPHFIFGQLQPEDAKQTALLTLPISEEKICDIISWVLLPPLPLCLLPGQSDAEAEIATSLSGLRGFLSVLLCPTGFA